VGVVRGAGAAVIRSTLQAQGEALLGRLGRIRHFRCRCCDGRFCKSIAGSVRGIDVDGLLAGLSA